MSNVGKSIATDVDISVSSVESSHIGDVFGLITGEVSQEDVGSNRTGYACTTNEKRCGCWTWFMREGISSNAGIESRYCATTNVNIFS